MKHVLIVIVSTIVLFTANPLKAEDRWSLEIRGDAASATQDLGDADLDIGFGSEVTVAYRFMPHLSGYAGWGYHKFSADQSFAGSNVDFEETGYTFGLQFIHPIGESNLSYLIQAGGIYNHIETENNNRNIIADSGHGLGWQIGVGLVIPISENWRLIPSVRYRSSSNDIKIAGDKTEMDLSYISTGIGLSWSF